MRWSAAWQDEPPLLMQIRDLLAYLVAPKYEGASPQDFMPKRRMEHQLPDTPAVAYFMKYNAEIEVYDIEH